MDVHEVMEELESLGTEQNRKVYKRHGYTEPMFGVSFANLGKFKKKIKVDHDLSQALWDSGNADAQILACMIADPNLLTQDLAESWAQEIEYYVLCDQFSALLAKAEFARDLLPQWMASSDEFIKQAGYSTLCMMLKDDPDSVSLAECKQILKTIENEIHDAPNRARHTMNSAVIAIGTFKPELLSVAMEAAKRIGKVDVDHGETSCKTPDAVSYMEKAAKRRKR